MREFMCTQCGHKFDVPQCNGQQGWQITCPQCNSQVRRVNNLRGGQFQNMGQGGFRKGCGQGQGQGQGKTSSGFGRGGGGNFFGAGSKRGQGLGKGFCRFNGTNNSQIKGTGTSGNKDI